MLILLLCTVKLRVHVISIYNLQVIAQVQCRKGEWSCYVWDFKEKRLNILDPLINQGGSNKQDAQNRHDSIKHVLLELSLPADRSTAAPHTDMIRITKNPAPTSGLSSFFKVLEGNM